MSESNDKPVAFIYEQKIADGYWDEKTKTEHPSVYLDDDQYRNVRHLGPKNQSTEDRPQVEQSCITARIHTPDDLMQLQEHVLHDIETSVERLDGKPMQTLHNAVDADVIITVSEVEDGE